MTPELSYHFFNKLGSDYFSLIYLGAFNDDLTTTLVQVNETGIKEKEETSFKKRLSFLIAECFHNIILHADKPILLNRTNNKPKMFLVRNSAKGTYVSTANLIENIKMPGLMAKLKSIKSLSKDELRAVYMDSLSGTDLQDTPDGGFGLMEMARQSNCRLEYDFEQVNYFFSNFFLQLEVITPEMNTAGIHKAEQLYGGEITLKSAKELYNMMVAENILMIRKGDFSQQSILPLLELISSNLNSDGKLPSAKKKMISLLVELLQNISKHAAEVNGLKEGIFIIASKDNKFTLNTGNFIETKNVESLKEKLKKVAGLDKDGLNAIYKDFLMNKEVGYKGSAGVGLIEVTKYSSEKILYNFKPVSEKLSFFSINITV